MSYPQPLEDLISSFERFPGIGRRSAERLAFHVLRDPEARGLAVAIERAARETQRCAECGNVTESSPCPICADDERDATTLCVVEEPRHVEAVERSGAFRGRFHVLMGALNPSDGTEARHLLLKKLATRLRKAAEAGAPVQEVILGTDPDAEGEATALAVLEVVEDLARAGVPRATVTRLARGLPAGSAIEYLHRGVLEDALEGRRPIRRR